MAVASGHMNSSGVLLEVGSVLPVLHSGEMQSAPGAVPASPAASGNSKGVFSLYSSPFRSPWGLAVLPLRAIISQTVLWILLGERWRAYLSLPCLGVSLQVLLLVLHPYPFPFFLLERLILTGKKRKYIYIHIYIYMSWSEMTETDRFEWLWSIQSSFLGLMLA